jgi:hypothetical protein
MAHVEGAEAIGELVGDILQRYGLNADPAIVALYVAKSDVESNFGAMNDKSGNGKVFGTWQMDYRNITGWDGGGRGVIAMMENGDIPESIIPVETQRAMAARFNEIRQANGGDIEATLKNQEANFIATYALAAHNQEQLLNRGVDVERILREQPDLTFSVRYFVHQLPPQDSAELITAMAENPNARIRDILPPDIINGNPATYKRDGRELSTVQEVIDNLNERYGNAQVNRATAAAAGVTLPSNESILAVISDLRANGQAEAAEQLNKVVQQYAANQNNAGEVSSAMNMLQQHIKELYEKNGVQFDDATNFMAMHLGPFSAAVALKADPNAKVSEAKVVIDGKETTITKESYDAFRAELQQKGIQLAAYEEATIAQLRAATVELYQKQRSEAQTLATQAQNGEENKRVDYFQQMTQQMMQQNPILGMIMMVFSFMVNSNNSNEASIQSPSQTQEQTAPAPANPTPTQSQSPVGDIVLPTPQTPVSSAVDAGANGVLPPAPQNLPSVARATTNEVTPG